ncbi:F-box protein GID2-like [Castanea sativa]|uniref:F-box protein GID2-like n=1 Tax=Castanea sativa TaxID=21020 RepID=UPI003F64C309
MNSCGRGLVENEEQDKKVKSIVVEEQEEEEEDESETRFVDLHGDVLHNVLKRVDVVTLGRAACVNKPWCKVARDERLWEPIATTLVLRSGGYGRFDEFRKVVPKFGGFRQFHRLCLRPLSKPPPSDFFSIDPSVFSRQSFSYIASTSSKLVNEMVCASPWKNAVDAILSNETSRGNQERMHNE